MIVDRASGPMRRMQRQAEQTDKAVRQLGERMDRAMGRDTTRSLEQHDQQMKRLDQSYRQASGSSAGFSNQQRRTNREIENGTDRLIKHGQAIAAVGKIFSVLKWPALVSGAGSLVQIISQLGGGVASLIPQLVNLTGVAAVLPSSFMAAGGAVATFALAFQGLSKALQAGIQLHQQAGITALQVADQHAQVAQSMVNAERGIMMAQRASTDAQLALTQARRDAIRNLTDLRLAARAAALGEQGANLTLEQARFQLQQMMFQPGTTGLQIRQQQLAVREASLGVTQSHVTRGRAVADRSRAVRLGVGGNQQVIQAERGVADAAFQARQATLELAAAQRQAAEAAIQGAGAQGQFDQAMRNLSPQAQGFVRHLLSMQGIFYRLRDAAQSDLFGGLTDALDTTSRGVPTAERLLRRFGGAIGGVAKNAASRFTTPGFLRDIEAVGNQGATGISRAGTALTNVADAFRHIAVAAIPFTDWFQRVIVRGSRWFDEWAAAGERSGKFALALDRTRHSLVLFWDMAKNLWVTLRNIGAAGRSTGNQLWAAADRATKRWRDFTGSFRGQLELRQYFANSEGTVRQVMGLIGDLGKAIFRMGQQPGAANLVHQLRAMVRPLETILTTMGRTFTSGLLKAITAVLKLLADLSGLASPLTVVVGLFTKLVNVIDGIARHSNVAKLAIASIFSLVLINKFLGKLGSVGDRLRGLIGLNRAMGRGAGGGFNLPAGVKGQVQPVYVVNMPAGGIPGAPGGPGGPGGGPNPLDEAGGRGGRGPGRWSRFKTGFRSMYEGERAMGAGRFSSFFSGMRGAVGRTGLGWSGALRALPARAGSFLRGLPGRALGGLRGAGTSLLEGIAGRGGVGGILKAGGSKLLGLGKGLLGGAADMFLPAAGISALIGAITTHGNVSDRARGALSAGTFGLSEKAANLLGFGAGPSEAKLAGGFGPHGGTGEAGLIQRTLGGMGGDNPTTRNLHQQVQYLQAMVNIRRGEKGAEGALSGELQRQLTIRKQILAAQDAREQAASVQHAQQLGGQLQRAFSNLKKADGPVGAMSWVREHMLGHMKNLKEQGRLQLAQSTVLWARQIARGNPAMQREVQTMQDQIVHQFGSMGDRIRIVNGQILTGSQTEWRGIASAITDQTNSAVLEGSAAFDKLQQKAIGSLRAMGFSPAGAQNILNGLRQGGAAGRSAGMDIQAGPTGRMPSGRGAQAATGRRIEGHGMRDTVPVAPGYWGAPGELILNRHTESKLDVASRLAFGRSVDQLVRGEHTPHHLATGGRVIASGAQIGHPELHQGIAQAAYAVLSQFPGLRVSATTNGRHAHNSLHYLGEAVDLAAPMTPPGIALMNRAAHWTDVNIGRALQEGIHNPNLSISHGRHIGPSFWGPQTWAEHANHIHLGVTMDGLRVGTAFGRAASMGRGRDVGMFRMGRLHTALGGAPGAMSQSVMDAMRMGMTQRINSIIGNGGGPIASASVAQMNHRFGQFISGSGRPSGQLSVRQIRMIAESVGFSPTQAMQMAQIAHGESGYYPGIQQRDPGDGNVGYGLWQMTPHAWGVGSPAYQKMMSLGGISGMFNPVNNARMAKYLFDQAGHSFSPWYGTRFLNRDLRGVHSVLGNHDVGGRIPWFGAGTDFVATRPQLIGVGDGGHERVTVTPVGRGGAGGIHIGQIVVKNHRPGDIKHQIKKEVREAFDELATELDTLPNEEPAL